METKWQQQKIFTIKNQNLELNAFLYSVINLSNKKINKHFDATLSDINDVKFNLYNLLDYDPIKTYNNLHVLYYSNGIISNITFKFNTGINMQLIYSYFYASRKKWWLLKYDNNYILCEPKIPLNIEFFYIEFSFTLFFFFFYFYFSFYFFLLYILFI
jgi:hypothetical protein